MSIKKEINILIKKYKYFLVGYSGGIDSTVLLYELYKQSLKNKIYIRAIHINHNMNIYSKKWSKHCKKICKKLNITLIIEKINSLPKKNIECSLRNKRYLIYKKNLLNKEIILTAHNKNDQCESFFLALKRGSGPKGLSGIKKKIKKKNIIYRPLLKISRQEIKYYALKKKLIWIKDNSNLNINLDRNFLRLLIIKKLVKKWPYFISSVYRSAKICLKQEKLINDILKNKEKKIIYKNTIKLKYLLKLKKNIAFWIIRKWLDLNNQLMISYKLMNYIWEKVNKLKNKIYFQIIFKKFLINKYKNTLHLNKKNKNIIKKKSFLWNDINKKFYLPYENSGYLKIEINKKNKKNLIRKPKKHESIFIKFNIKNKIKIKNKKKKIKKIWQEKKIYPWKRKFIPIIFYNKIPILCPDIFITKYGKPTKNSQWTINWIKKKK